MEQNEIDPYRFSKEVIEYFNMVRSNPKKFASIIREYKQYFKGKVLRVPNSKVGIMTKEGADAFEEAAKYLDSVKAINTVKYNVSKWIKGERYPGTDYVYYLAQVLEVSIEELL